MKRFNANDGSLINCLMENKINAPRGILASERWRNVKMLLGSATLILAIAHFALYVGAAKAAELDGA